MRSPHGWSAGSASETAPNRVTLKGFQSPGGDFSGTYFEYAPSCDGGQLFLSGNGSALQYDFVFAPPFDSNGSTHLLGVTSSTAVPNTAGAPFRGNFMEAFRNSTH